MGYSVVKQPPSPETYCELRKKAGLSPKSLETAQKALPNTSFGCSIIDNDTNTVVGMGRLVGDDAAFLTVVDIAVLPEHQKKGLGKLIMETLMNHVNEHVNPDCYVSLIADGDASFLYAKFGFVSTLPKSQSMYFKRQ